MSAEPNAARPFAGMRRIAGPVWVRAGGALVLVGSPAPRLAWAMIGRPVAGGRPLGAQEAPATS